MLSRWWNGRIRAGGVMALLGVAAFALSACATSFVGGGWDMGVNGGKAHISLSFECSKAAAVAAKDTDLSAVCVDGRARGTYMDQGAGVRMRFDGVVVAGIENENDQIPNNCMGGILRYVSTNKAAPGEGVVLVIACDDVEQDITSSGPENGDVIFIMAPDTDGGILSGLDGGPYAGYMNVGALQAGNFKALK